MGPLVRLIRDSSTLGYVSENCGTLVDRYLRDTLLVEHPIHRDQHTYSMGRSTETALEEVVIIIETQLEAKGYLLVSMLDIEDAFNNTSRKVIRKALLKHEIPLPIMN